MNRVDFFGAVSMALGLAIWNFIWQAIQADPAWMTAGERTFFQSIAILLAWIMWRDR